jgi:hypothetical protein
MEGLLGSQNFRYAANISQRSRGRSSMSDAAVGSPECGGHAVWVLGGRTKYALLLSVMAVTASIVLTRQAVVGARVASLFGGLALVGFPLFSALACLWCAREIDAPSTQRQWVLLGGASLAAGAGQFLEEFTYMGQADSVTIAEVIYLVAIAMCGAGVWMALRSFEGLVDIRKPMRISVAVATAVSVTSGVALASAFGKMHASLADKILLGLYPLGLIWLMGGPALALALTVSQLGSGVLARPWWAVFVGVTVLASSTLLLIVSAALGSSLTDTGPMEIGWWIGLSAVAVGATIQVDVLRPTSSATR